MPKVESIVAIVDNASSEDARSRLREMCGEDPYQLWPTHYQTPETIKNLPKDITNFKPVKVLLVAGDVAHRAIPLSATRGYRTLFIPHPLDKCWNNRSLAFVKRLIQEGQLDLEVIVSNGKLRARRLIPF